MVKLNASWGGEARLPNGTVVAVVNSICQKAGPDGRPHSEADVQQAQEMVDACCFAGDPESDSLLFAANE